MSDLMTDEEQIIWFLREFENAEDEQLEDCELEIYGEDDEGREGTCTISVQDIAKKAADFIKKLTAERDNALAQNAELVAQVEAARKLYVRLTNNVEFADNGEGCYVADGKLMADFDRWSDTAPTKHLRDIQAEAVDKFSAWVIDSPVIIDKKQLRLDIFKATNQYADRIRRGEV